MRVPTPILQHVRIDMHDVLFKARVGVFYQI